MKRILCICALICSALVFSASGCTKERPITPPDRPVNGKDEPSKDDSGNEGEQTELSGKKFLVCANSMVYYGGFVQKGNPRMADEGMFYKIMKNKGIDVTVVDCTYGGHHLYDFISTTGCQTSGGGCPGIGEDLLKGVDLSKIDYVIISEAGNNYDHFYSDAVALFKRVTDANPNAKKMYINHVYSVYKKHGNVLNNLKKLHDEQGVTIVNCGQLAYDIYTGAVKVPGGSLQYSDRYTFTNHTSSDTYHPNPLMGYIMTQMVYCALTGESADNPDYLSLVKSCNFAAGSTTYAGYYGEFYPNPAALPFHTVLENTAEMKGIQKLIPSYINKY